MKLILALLFFFINLTVFAQEDSKKLKMHIDFVGGVEPSIAFLDKNMNNIFGGYAFFLFDNKVYTGVFLEKKYGETKAKNPINDRFKGGDLHYANGGAIIGMYFFSQAKKIGRKPAKPRLLRANISLKTGVGRIWIVNKSNNKLYDRINYLGCFNIRAGLEYPLGKIVAVGGGGDYHFTTNNKIYFEDSVFSGFGFYFNLRFSFLNNPRVQGHKARF